MIMQPDEWQKAWAAHGALLERSLAIDERLLREAMLRKVRFALTPYALRQGLAAAAGLVALFEAGVPVLVAHLHEPRYVVAAGALVVFLAAITALCVYLLVRSLRLDYDGPVTAIQRDVERIKLAEYRAVKWTLLGGVVIWLPAALMVFEAVTGVPALGRAHFAWLVGNLVFGLVVLAIGQALSKRYVERTDLGPWSRRVVDALSGRSLRSVSRHLDELARFQRETR